MRYPSMFCQFLLPLLLTLTLIAQVSSEMFRRNRPSDSDVRSVQIKPSWEEISRWRNLYENSPWRFSRCTSGHIVDLFTNNWELRQTKSRGWFAAVRCDESVQDGYSSGVCQSGVMVDLPVDPGEISVAVYPTHHESDGWRQAAAILPRTNGFYACYTHKSESDVHKCYDGILFNDDGSVFAFDFKVFTGLFPPLPFKGEAREAMKWFNHPSPREERRGLYSVRGQEISFTVYDMYGSPAEYSGGIDGRAKELKLRVSPVGYSGRKPLKRTYKFHTF